MPDDGKGTIDFLADLTSCREIEEIISIIRRDGAISFMDRRLLETHCRKCKECEAKFKAVSKS